MRNREYQSFLGNSPWKKTSIKFGLDEDMSVISCLSGTYKNNSK